MVNLHALACACAIALPHLTLFILFLLDHPVGVMNFYNPTSGPHPPSILGYVYVRLACRTGINMSLTTILEELGPWKVPRNQKQGETLKRTRTVNGILYLH